MRLLGREMEEIILLTRKMYSIRLKEGGIKSAKGIGRTAVKGLDHILSTGISSAQRNINKYDITTTVRSQSIHIHNYETWLAVGKTNVYD